MDNMRRRVLVRFTALMTAPLAVLHAADRPRSASKPNAASDDQADKATPQPNVLIIGASSLNSPVALTQLLGAMLESRGIHANVEGQWPQLDAVSRMLSSQKAWDYVVMDAWHLGRGRNEAGSSAVPAEFSKAVAAFVKQVRAHSPECKIILFPWWIPGGPKATNEGAMDVFRRCVEEAERNHVWVATTGPAFMEARLERPDLRIVRSKTDAHPGIEGAYINACSLFAVITGRSPVGLPATLPIRAAGGKKVDCTVAPDDAKYLQQLAWKVYQREIKDTKPTKERRGNRSTPAPPTERS